VTLRRRSAPGSELSALGHEPYPFFGALPARGAVTFRVWAPAARELRLVLQGGAADGEHSMPCREQGLFELTIGGIGRGQRYAYRIDRADPLPDPASRFQPEGVHGFSEVVDPWQFAWHDDAWRVPQRRDLVIYELHVGTFAGSGTFQSARERLATLSKLGITAIELMPVADFPGSRNWGYDGAALFAPSRAYGRPDDLRALVDAAHGLGLAVILDVVYNHLGPEGAYVLSFNPFYLNDRHSTPWGRAVNLDGPGGEMVRRFILDNAVHWIREYHIDGLRIDATHALIDTTRSHLLRDLAATVRRESGRDVLLFAEDQRNLASIVAADGEEAWSFDGVWADDFHHIVRRIVAGDAHGYFADYGGNTSELARTISQGWLFSGETSPRLQRPRGTDPSAVPMDRFVVCLQNHDQIGNRALGDRLHHGVDLATWRAVSVVLLTVPMTPLLFMGQEWAASTPLLYFTDHSAELGRLVTDGRRLEFREFPAFSSAETRDTIPDPQSPATFEASRLRWTERNGPPHAGVLALYERLLSLRHAHPALGASEALRGESFAPDERSIVIRRRDASSEFRIAACLRGSTTIVLDSDGGMWEPVLTTEEESFASDPQPPVLDLSSPRQAVIEFKRPSAVIVRRSGPARDNDRIH
jgi:maltooligosyltrehalose trehalohydrolase